jgi:hypothetical protein
MSGRQLVCEDAAAIAERLAEIQRERVAAIAGCRCPQRTTAGEVVHVTACPLGPAPPSSQMQATLEAMARARARLRQAGVPIRAGEESRR